MDGLQQFRKRIWDVLVIGAGPAGALAAGQIARRGLSVLLVDKAPFGRWKVCGCCLNGAAQSALAAASLGDLPKQLAGVPLTQLRLAAVGCRADVPLPQSVVVSRERFDAALIRQAIECGVVYSSETFAKLALESQDFREVRLIRSDEDCLVKARLVLAADGLGSKLTKGEGGCEQHANVDSKIGAGAVFEMEANHFERGTVYMACSADGYVGIVKLEDGRINLAAALDRSAMAKAGGPGPASAAILSEVGLQVPAEMLESPWRGTAPLTQAPSRLWANRLLVLGDAAGYVEPFTGEGMSWALASAMSVASFAVRGADAWSPEVGQGWNEYMNRTIRLRQGICKYLAWGLRHPRITRMAVKLLELSPALARPITRRLSAPSFNE
jgi:flavin-dependent dehydrogenase